MNKKIVIIGAGLGGLETGYILAKHGLDVCILEKGLLLGGCLQSYKRKGQVFDTGMHYVGAKNEGESLNTLFNFFELNDLSWHKLDDNCFDEVIIKGEKYSFANGYDKFVNTLSQQFPNEKDNLRKYTDFLKTVGDNIFTRFTAKDNSDISTSLFGQGAYDFLCNTFNDQRLINVVSGTSLKMELRKDTLPLYTFAQINDSFIRSAYRLENGGSQIGETLADKIKAMGGAVRTNAEVEELVENDGKIVAAILTNGERIEGDIFISNLHPAATLGLVKESEKIRKIYRNRICGLSNTMGMFTVSLKLKKETLPYQNHNKYIYETDDVWAVSENLNKLQSCLVSYAVPQDKKWADNIDLLVPMSWNDVEKWNGTKVMQRGDEYKTMKNNKAHEIIEFAAKHIEGLKEAIEDIYTSTPLTYSDYVATPAGSAYGVRKDFSKVMQTVLTPRTPVENLLLTGQSLNLHGVLGVSMTSFFTAAEVIGMDAATSGLDLKI